ncbi:MAG TPA: aminotransferase class I/II-fold pyridoxal phosphate-dependent enzyme, partial [Alphaproteobacteria bacterium]|nr:aminotransferase class I/II-fold pyridoxal phosphate-dependent enzyme [Alphaproteobacteria bacterium]
YLGFEQDKDVLNAQIEGLKFYGNVVPWSRTVATFGIYTRAENVLAKLVGSPAANMFLSTTLLNHGVIQALAGKKGAVIAFEQSAHKSLYEGAMLAKAKGAKVFGWKTLKDLEKILEKDACYKLVITDGVHSMSGSFAPLKELWALCERLDGYLYIDDAHGFGVVGENPSNDSPLGHKGNGLVGYFDIPFGRVFYVGCFSKAYGLSGAFIACTKEQKNFLLEQATPHDLGFSGQAGAITGLLKALELNHQKGDVKRRQLLEYSLQVTKVLEKKGYELYTKTTSFPIVTVLFHHDAEFLAFCKRLYERGILATVEPYLLKKPSILHGIRLTLTASHTKKDIQDLLGVF